MSPTNTQQAHNKHTTSTQQAKQQEHHKQKNMQKNMPNNKTLGADIR
jgi:hypothetical protein